MSIESLKQQARKHEQNEEWEKALDQYNKALAELARDEQVDIGLYNRVGDLYVRVGQLDQAFDHYDKAVDLYREAYLPNNAIAVCKKIIRNMPNRHQAYLRIGQIRAEQGFLPDARENFLTYAERMQQDGEIDESFRALIEFCDLAPDDIGVRVTVAEQMAGSGRTEDAIEQFLIARSRFSENGDQAQADELEKKVLELDPDADLGAVPAIVDAGGDFGSDELDAGFGEISVEADDDSSDFAIGMGEEAEIEIGAADEDDGFAIASGDDEEEAAELPMMEIESADEDEEEAVEIPMMEIESADEDEEEAVEIPMMEIESADEDEEEAVELPMMEIESADEDEEEAAELPMMEIESVDVDEEEAEPLPTMEIESVDADEEEAEPLPTMEIEAEEEEAEPLPTIEVEETVAEAVEDVAGEPAVEEEPVVEEPEPAAEPEPASAGGGDGFVDLGAMILGGDSDQEKSTRLTVAYEEPTGDEEADFAKMLSQFKEKINENLDSSDVRAHYDLGTAYKEMGLLDEAISSFQAALRAASNHLPTYEVMGQTFIEMGQPEAAVKVLKRALESNAGIEDDLVGIYYYLARSYEALEDKSSALEYYDRVFSLDINFADVTERLRELR